MNDNRSAQDMLAERRQLVQEARFERDAVARKLYEYQIAEIDRELARRRASS